MIVLFFILLSHNIFKSYLIYFLLFRFYLHIIQNTFIYTSKNIDPYFHLLLNFHDDKNIVHKKKI